MRLNWIIPSGNSANLYDIYAACEQFFKNNHMVPDTIKMTYHDMSILISQMPVRINILEKGKTYGNFLSIPGGLVELLVLDHTDETTVNIGGGSMFVVESTQIDREFEKIVLNKGDE